MVVTRSSNNFGPYQFPEKVIPLFVTNLLDGQKVPLYGDGLQRPRLDLRRGQLRAASTSCCGRATVGEVYNIGGGNEITNRELTDRLLALCGAGDEIDRVRRRTASVTTAATPSTTTKVTALGWRPPAPSTRRSPPPSSGTGSNRGLVGTPEGLTSCAY